MPHGQPRGTGVLDRLSHSNADYPGWRDRRIAMLCLKNGGRIKADVDAGSAAGGSGRR